MITLATLPTASAQEVFDQVVTHLLTQRRQSVSDYDDCLYRSGKLRCAAGCLVSDAEYFKGMEGNNWAGLLAAARVPKEHAELITHLQDVHDGYHLEAWESRLKQVAECNGLDFNWEEPA